MIGEKNRGEIKKTLDIMSEKEFITDTQTQCPMTGVNTPTSRLTYWWVIMFEWDVNKEKPFQIFLKEEVSGVGVPKSWFEGCLNDNCRKLKLRLSGFSGDKYSFFCKVETGKVKI